ncbi:MAG: DUF885 domain-containing protein [Candidatus Limnocylindrales bacterium]
MPTQSSFADLADRFLKEELADSPVLASSLGVDGFDDQLDDLSAEAYRRRDASATEWLGRFRAVPDEGLSADEAIDRDFLISILRGREIIAPHQMWKRQPATYLNPGLYGVFTLFLHKLHPESELADAARARLLQVPTALRHGIDNLDLTLAPRLYLDRAIGQAAASARYARELVALEVSDPVKREQVAAAGAEAADAYDAFGAFLKEKRDKATGSYAIGEAMYTALLREKELLPYDARQLRERGREQYDLLAAEAKRLAKEISGSDDWVGLLAKLNTVHAATPEAMRDEYADWTERARTFLRETGLVTLPPGETCSVDPSPPFQRPVLAVASYQRPPAFTDSLAGHFFVPFPPDGTSAEEIQKRLEGNCSAGIPTTAVHEAYPGHHWHLVMAHSNPSAIRKIFNTSYFSEGWALYAERVMREQGFFTDPKAELYQYEATIFRAARIIVDTSLHLGEMSFDQAVKFMIEKGNLSEPNAKAEVGRYCSWPTQAASYLTGMLEIVDLRTRWLARRGRNDITALREFHDKLTSTGNLPTSLAERAIA